jgi:Holliday junction resolvase RusA-like endonuclease
MLPLFVEINLRYPTFNEYIDKERRHRQIAGKMKKEYTNATKLMLMKYKKHPLKFPVQIEFLWFAKTSARDIDGYSFGKKCVLDAMVGVGLLPDDNIKFVRRTIDDVMMAKRDGVIIKITEYTKDGKENL